MRHASHVSCAVGDVREHQAGGVAMTRTLFISIALLGILAFLIMRWESFYNAAQPPIVTRVDIYTDRVTYRTGVYATTTALAIGLKAANDPPEVVELHDCTGRDQLEAVLDLLREQGTYRFDIVLPDHC